MLHMEKKWQSKMLEETQVHVVSVKCGGGTNHAVWAEHDDKGVKCAWYA